MKRFLALVFLIFISVNSLAALYRDNYDLVLSTGERVYIDRFVEMYAGGSKEWILAIEYDADNIENIALLCKRAKLIWPHLRPFVEAKEWSWGSVRATKKTTVISVGGVKRTESVAMGLPLTKLTANGPL